MSVKYNNPTKEEMIDFFRENFGQQDADLTTLSGIKNALQRQITLREDKLTQMGVYQDDWLDDEILGQMNYYLDFLNKERINNELNNIQFSKNISAATRSTLPDEMTKKIQSYGVTKPENADSKFAIINKLGGKSRNSRKLRKSRKNNRKSRKNNRKSRRHNRKSRRHKK